MNTSKYADPSRSTRHWITTGLVVSGAVAGAILGVVLTPLGKIVTGAPPADLANFARNALAFGVIGACIGPIVTWTALRNAPFWRTVVEPLAGCLVGAAVGLALGSGALLLALIPVGGAVAAARLAVTHRR